MNVELHGTRLVVRTVRESDHERLAELGMHPEVARWWPGLDPERVRREMLPIDEDGTFGFTIVLDGSIVGYMQAWEESDPEYRHAGIDLFVDPALRGQGIGPEAIRTVARWLIDERRHHRLTIDPRADNASAIRAYEKVGFRPVGRLREYQLDPDGRWYDGLLMDMLASELTPRDGR
jgi:aminoglycoside 6'-N-acetyltransferase